jgi:hypothetical protein
VKEAQEVKAVAAIDLLDRHVAPTAPVPVHSLSDEIYADGQPGITTDPRASTKGRRDSGSDTVTTMTIAVCLVCGARKLGAFLPCSACDWEPVEDEDLVRSMLLTDHYQPEAELERIGTALAGGTEVVIPEELVQELLPGFAERRASVSESFAPRPASASAGSPAAEAQARLAEVLTILGGREHSRARYLHARLEGTPLMDEVVQAAMTDAILMKKSPDPTHAGWLARLACLPFAPHTTLVALHVLGSIGFDKEDAGRAVDTIAALPEPRPRQVEAVLAHLCPLLAPGVPYPHDVHARLKKRLEAQKP